MSKPLHAGTLLSSISGSSLQMPLWRFEIWDPNYKQTTIGDVVAGRTEQAPLDITHFVQSASFSDNVGFENLDDPSIPSVQITFKPSAAKGIKLRRGLVDNGVILRVWRYDVRVNAGDAVCIFTGHFRGAPGVDPGTRADLSVGITATAYGREEQFLNLMIDVTEEKPAGTDLGEIFFQVATKHMGLTQDEILVGTLGVVTRHQTNQIKGISALQALWECTFPAGKKPKFNGEGKLTAVDFRLDKPAARIYSAGNHPIRSLRYAPNDVEVNNSVVLLGLDHNQSKVIQEMQMLRDITVTIGFFMDSFRETYHFSAESDKIRADSTRLRARKRIPWSDAHYTQNDEFTGTVSIDTNYLAAVREIIFASYLAIELAIIVLDLAMAEGGTSVANAPIPTPTGPSTVAIWRTVLKTMSQVTLALLLWSMQFIGTGRYQIWGKPFEYCYKELKSRYQLAGLRPEQVREVEIRNDFISTMEALDEAARERLRRELVKNQAVDIEMVDDPSLEVDDVLETWNGSRFYIVSTERDLRGMMRLKAWKVYADFMAAATTFEPPEPTGYGFGYGENWGEGF